MNRIPLGRLAILLFLAPGSAFGATYYTGKTGSDSNSCVQAQSESTPKQTIAAGVSCLSSGETLIVKAGTYDIATTYTLGTPSPPSGTSWQNATTIKANPGDTVIVKRDASIFSERCFELNYAGYIIINGFSCDGSNKTGTYCFYGYQSHHIRLTNLHCYDWQGQGIYASNGDDSSIQGYEIINNRIENIAESDFGHGIYLNVAGSKIHGNVIHGIAGWGMSIYPQANNMDIQNNITYNNSQAVNGRGSGIMVAGNNNLVANNISYGNNRCGIEVYYGSNNKIFNNTTYNNDQCGILLAQSTTTNTLVANNITYETGADITDSGTGNVFTSNMTADPLFADVSTFDFSLREESPAIDAGVELTESSVDFVGVSRPQRSAFDIGAFEFTGSSASPPAPTPLPPSIVSDN